MSLHVAVPGAAPRLPRGSSRRGAVVGSDAADRLLADALHLAERPEAHAPKSPRRLASWDDAIRGVDRCIARSEEALRRGETPVLLPGELQRVYAALIAAAGTAIATVLGVVVAQAVDASAAWALLVPLAAIVAVPMPLFRALRGAADPEHADAYARAHRAHIEAHLVLRASLERGRLALLVTADATSGR